MAKGGLFSSGSNWTDGSAPTSGDSATFAVPGSYAISFVTIPTNMNLSVGPGANPAFLASGTTRTYTLTGGVDVASSGSITLGGLPTFPVSLAIAGGLFAQGNVNVTGGADVAAGSLTLGAGSGITAAYDVTGVESSLSTTGETFLAESGASASLTYRDGATGRLSGDITVSAGSISGTKGALNILSGAFVSHTGRLTLAAGTAGGRDAILTVANATFTQGTNLATNAIEVGDPNGGVGGTAAVFIQDDGVLNSATLTIYRNGKLEASKVDPGATSGGTLNLHGNLYVAGGSLALSDGGTIQMEPGTHFRVTDGGVASLGNYSAPPSASLDASGSGSRFTAGTLDISRSATLSLSSSGYAAPTTLLVGDSSVGTVDVSNRGFITQQGASGNSIVGFNAGGNGSLSLTSRATATFEGSLTIGAGSGKGNLSLSIFSALTTSSLLVATDQSSAKGTVWIDRGTLNISPGGRLTVGSLARSQATITLARGSAVNVDDSAATTIFNTGTIDATESDSTFRSGASLTIDGGTLRAAGALVMPPGATLTLRNGGTAMLDQPLPLDDNRLAMVSGTGTSLVVSSNVLVGSSATRPGTLIVSDSATFTAAQTTLAANGTMIFTDANADLGTFTADGGLIVLNAGLFRLDTSAATVRQLVDSGKIITLTDQAIGYVPDGSSLLVKLTVPGDANLDGVVNGDDYALLDRGYAAGGTSWWTGDFDYDGAVTAADYLLIDQAFVRQGPGAAPEFLAMRESQFGLRYVSALLAGVPEPSLAELSIAWVLFRRRRSAQ